ncbi:MAG: nickel transporter [Hyphomicrobiaceae bacterium]|nr:nickel transporter [Hyphomicrobiaceae bacterium]
MEVVPVIDVARGEVVRGVKGDRASYKRIVTPLTKSAEPAEVAGALMGLYPFRKIYVADLDGIEGRGRNVHLVPSLSAALGQSEIWIDAGVTSPKAARAVLAAPVTTLIVGSESVEQAGEFSDIAAESPQRTILSLDFRGDEFMGPRRLLEDASVWPDRVIVMTLARVGSEEGPDLARVGEIIARAGRRKVYAAGGVRDAADLVAVKAVGAAGVLVASALHSGRITPAQLKKMAVR